MTPKAEMRVLVGLVVQPFVAFAAAFVAFPAMAYAQGLFDPDRGSYAGSFDGAGPVALGAALAAVFVVIVGAVPAIAWLSRRGPLTLGKALISGALLGSLPAVVILLLAALTGNLRIAENRPAFDLPRMLPTIGFGAFVGMACALVFWAVARDATDDRKQTSSRSGSSLDSRVSIPGTRIGPTGRSTVEDGHRRRGQWISERVTSRSSISVVRPRDKSPLPHGVLIPQKEAQSMVSEVCSRLK
jgi:hypothetical protein